MRTLVKQAQHGDPEAFIRLMEENKQAMKRVAFGFFQNEEDVADAIQDTILDAFENIGSLKKADYFSTWLIRILINNCNKIFNHNKRSYSADTLPEMERTQQTDGDVEFMELLSALPSDSRVIFQLYYGEQYTTREIADILRMNESTVKSKIHRGKERLKAQLQGI